MTQTKHGEAPVLFSQAMLIINILPPVTPPEPNNLQILIARPEVLYDAWKLLPGIEYPRDGSEGKAGIFWVPSSEDPRTETRSYARTAHYDRVQNRSNYAIITGHKVAKINFSQDHKSLTATSVEILSRIDNPLVTTITANKEIILAAGTIHTPQILQLSGIGPRSVLKSANISLVLDLPGVGSNFQDHSWFAMGYDCKQSTNKWIAS
jgi:choline dehydrogenase